VEGFLAGRSSLRPFEHDELGGVTRCSLAHTQCHFGQDTLSWGRHGAQVTGLDFSAPAIAAARSLAAPLGEVVSAIISAGPRLEYLHEHPYTESVRWPFLVRDADRIYRMPEGQPELPLVYSLLATPS
jgi:hypothetical protein